MNSVLRRTMRLSVMATTVGFLAACGGDANEQGAATTDTAGTATVAAAPGDVGAGSAVNPQEAVAFMMAADSSEIQAARVAATKATDSEVKQFAQKMQREHGRSAREIDQLAKQMNVNLQASGQHGQMVQSLQQMAQQTSQQLNSTPKGPEFDRAYMDSQVQAHQTVLENLQRIAGTSTTSGRDTTQGAAGPQQAAQKMIPHVQQHLEEARRIQTRLGGSGGTR